MGYAVNPVIGGSEPENPRSIAGGATETIFFDKDPGTVSISDGESLYIRIALSGETACPPTEFLDPTVRLRVITTTGVAGNLFDFDEPSGCLSLTNDSDTLCDMDHRVGIPTITKITDPFRPFTNVFQVQIAGIENYGYVDHWEIQIVNNEDPGTFVRVVWVVADIETDACQPWLDVSSPPLDFNALTLGTILPGDFISHTLTVANRGTGPVDITGLDIDPPEFSGNFGVIAPVAIEATSCGEITIGFTAPALPGPCDSLGSLVSNDMLAQDNPASKHNKQVDLDAYCGNVEIVMVLDASGSMGLPTGGGAAAVSRWDSLKVAVNLFLDHLGIFSGGKGNIGIVLFPNPTDEGRYTVPTSDPIHSSASIEVDPSEISGIMDPLDTLTPSGRTPMCHGILTAFGEFQTGISEQEHNNRWMVIMSDGEHNLGDSHPRDLCSTDPGSPNPFQDQNIRVFAVAYGDPGDTIPWPPHEQMRSLADASIGEDVEVEEDFNYRAAGDLDPHALAHDFKAAIATAMALELPEDPPGMLTSGRPEARHSVHILPYDTRVAFMVNWSGCDQDRVDVRLLTPLCELITPDLAAREAHLEYYGRPSYAIYAVHPDYLRNASDPAHPRYGPWTLVVTGRGLEDGDQETYTYDVITRSDLKMRPRFDQRRYWAGDPITVSVRLLLNGKPIPDATVSMRVEAPGEAAQNWMARQKVSPKDFEKAKEQLKGKDVTALDIKTHAVIQQGRKFDPLVRPQKIILTDPSRQGVYSATFTRTTVPGNYKFHISAVGQTPDRLLFRRERQIHQYVGVRPVADYTFYHAGYRKIFDDNYQFLQIDIRVWPRDQFNNVVLFPGEIHRRIALAVNGAQSKGPLKDNLDGSYSAVFRCDVDTQASIDLKVYGHQVFDKQRLLPVNRLRYADKVFEYKPGTTAQGEGAPHDEPEAALGDVTLKGDDDFVHLGLYGRLTLGVKDKAVYAGDGDDVVVFVQPSEDRCDYRVEALPMGSGAQWVILGTSPGVTRAFGLEAAGIRAAEAIRVIDRSGSREPGPSGRNHGSGVAIQGMGFGKVGPLYDKKSGCLAWPLALIRKLSASNR